LHDGKQQLVQVLEAQEAEEEALAETQRRQGSWLWFKIKTLEWNQERGYWWLDYNFQLISSSNSSYSEEDGESPAEHPDDQKMLSPRLGYFHRLGVEELNYTICTNFLCETN
jgi:hypothetical protein